jgi:hypothetical protein
MLILLRCETRAACPIVELRKAPVVAGYVALDRLPHNSNGPFGLSLLGRSVVLGCPETGSTRRHSPNRLPVPGTGAAPCGAAQEHGSGNPERVAIVDLEVVK